MVIFHSYVSLPEGIQGPDFLREQVGCGRCSRVPLVEGRRGRRKLREFFEDKNSCPGQL